TMYYRLNQVDYNKSQHLSKVIAVSPNTPSGSVTLYPNPAMAQVTVEFFATASAKGVISVFSETGIKVLEQTVIVNQGVNSSTLSLSSLPSSVYFVKIEGIDGLNKVYKLVKE